MRSRGLRLLVWDRTCLNGSANDRFLASAWWAGSALYPAMGRFDATLGATSWDEALAWLASHRGLLPIDAVEYWGHGKWGAAYVARERMDATWLERGHSKEPALAAIRARMRPGSRWWFRTCETVGRAEGHDFARRWSRYFDARVAGHTYVIGAWQSGLHSVGPGEDPYWSVTEGVDGDRGDALPSRRSAPNTVTFLHGDVPAGW